MTDNKPKHDEKTRAMWRKARKKYRLKNLDRIREEDKKLLKARYNKNPEKQIKWVREYMKKYPEKPEIRSKTYKLGIKKVECQNCKSKNNLEYHHINYKPVKIIVLCRKCHRAVHRKYEPLVIKYEK